MLFQNIAFAASTKQGSFASSMIIMVVFLVLMYLLLLRPQRKKEKETQQMRDALRVGDQVTTIGGFMGTIVKIKDDSVVISLGADKMKVEAKKWAIGEVNKTSGKPAPKAEKTEEKAEEEPKRKGPKMLRHKSEEEAEEPKKAAKAEEPKKEEVKAEEPKETAENSEEKTEEPKENA